MASVGQKESTGIEGVHIEARVQHRLLALLRLETKKGSENQKCSPGANRLPGPTIGQGKLED